MQRSLLLFFVSLAFFAFSINAQNITQTVRGNVVDKDSREKLYSVVVGLLKDNVVIKYTNTDEEGRYRFSDIPVGRYTMVAMLVGYQKIIIPEVLVGSGKEIILEIQMEESAVELKEIVITSEGNKGSAKNELAMVSARSFTVDETDRYAGSRGDPSRMASNFAGVQGGDDSNNGIVVRGNTPYGLLWRLENVSIPNPNHFNTTGRTNGAISMLNNKYLTTSDFFTSAFPAEFGNSIGSAFDLRMKNGNNEKFEFAFQFGLFGTEAFAEGPISKSKKSSFLVSYRYATVTMFQALGFDLGTIGKPFYHDAAFKLNYPTNKGNLSFFGIGGQNSLVENYSEVKDINKVSIYTDATDQVFLGKMGVVGANYGHTLSQKTFMNFTLAASHEGSWNNVEDVFRHIENNAWQVDSMRQRQWFNYSQDKYSANFYVNHKFSPKHMLKFGMQNDIYAFNFKEDYYLEKFKAYTNIIDFKEKVYLAQPFLQWRGNLSNNFSLTAGLHGQFFNLNNSKSLEPRAGLKWIFYHKHVLSAGIGLHSQMLPAYVYFQKGFNRDSSENYSNKNLDFMRSRHASVGYTFNFRSDMRLKIEAYYQHLNSIPVEDTASTYSGINEGDDYNDEFPEFLVSKGTGKNYGLEFTVEKFFTKGFMFLVTGSIFDSKYTGGNGVEYNTIFNSRYMINTLALKEFKWEKKHNHTLSIGGKIMLAGGKRYTPIDVEASKTAGRTVYIDSLTFTQQFRNYFRTDLRIAYKLNAKKVSHEIGIDIVNLLDRKNILRVTYVGGENPLRETYQLRRLPIFYYKIEF